MSQAKNIYDQVRYTVTKVTQKKIKLLFHLTLLLLYRPSAIIVWTLLLSHGPCSHYADPIVITWTLLSSHRPHCHHIDPPLLSYGLTHCCTDPVVIAQTCYLHCVDAPSSLHKPTIFIAWTLHYCHMDLPSSLLRSNGLKTRLA
jgi:hypothetical protein